MKAPDASCLDSFLAYPCSATVRLRRAPRRSNRGNYAYQKVGEVYYVGAAAPH
jgi:hypothetical protein